MAELKRLLDEHAPCPEFRPLEVPWRSHTALCCGSNVWLRRSPADAQLVKAPACSTPAKSQSDICMDNDWTNPHCLIDRDMPIRSCISARGQQRRAAVARSHGSTPTSCCARRPMPQAVRPSPPRRCRRCPRTSASTAAARCCTCLTLSQPWGCEQLGRAQHQLLDMTECFFEVP